jgi:DNA polymerase (family X)
MTGRQLLRRPGYDLDIERVLHVCAEHGVLEINGNPWRLDLDWRWHQRGLELRCLFSINPDAHPSRKSTRRRIGALKLRAKEGSTGIAW